MELAYEKLMKEHNLSLSDLPPDARVGIDAIQGTLNGIRLQEKKGKPTNPKVYDKIKTNDKWVVREILDMIEDKDTNTAELPHTKAELKEVIDTPAAGTPAAGAPAAGAPKTDDQPAQATAGTTGTTAPDAKGLAIEAELKALFDGGRTAITLDELKAAAKATYDHIWDTYEAGGQNGVETSHYSLMETEKEKFTLKKA